MESRTKKYAVDDYEVNSFSQSTRSSRNANLYREVYGKYGNLDNLPIEDNTNEIDINKLKELVATNLHPKKENTEALENLNILEQRKRRIDEQKVYDINKILEKAKYENNKLKEPVSTSKPRRDILSTLESTELSLDDIRVAKDKITKEEEKEEALSMTRELKYKNLEETIKKDTSNDSSLDLFGDLMGTENTITTKPIIPEKKEEEFTKPEFKPKTSLDIKGDISPSDTSDIDIIKKNSNALSSDFFTNSYEFSKKDFMDDEDFFDKPSTGGTVFKVILLILAIIIFAGVIVYFVGTYGLGL